METEEAADLIRESIDPEAEIIFGTTINEELQDEVIVTVIATGLEDDIPAPEPRRVAQPVEKVPEATEEVVEESAEETAEQRPARRFADLDDFESEIKIPDFLTRKKF